MSAPPAPGGIDTYDKLVESIGLWLGRDDLADQIPTFIQLTEKDLGRLLNLREQETTKDGTMVAGREYLELPDDLLIPRHLRIDTDPVTIVSIVSMDKFTSVRELAASAGQTKPTAATMVGNRLYLAPAPGADTYTLFYRGRLIPLSSSNSTNRILQDAPDALLYGALMHSAPFIGDDQRVELWGTMYVGAKQDYKKLEWNARLGGGTLRVRSDVNPNDQHNIGGA
jgi:hypothetical protein